MRKLRFLLFVLAALWLVVELAAIPVANGLIASRVSAQTKDVAGVKAGVGTFPVITRYALTGTVPSLSLALERVTRLSITFAEVRFDLHGVDLDRTELLGGKAHITAIERGSVTATIDASKLAPGLGLIGSVPPGVRVSGRSLLIGTLARSLSRDILPCEPTVRTDGPNIVMSCTVTDVPPVLLESFQQ